MEVTRKGYYTIVGPDGLILLKSDGTVRQVTSRDECYERITDDGRGGDFTILCPDRVVSIAVDEEEEPEPLPTTPDPEPTPSDAAVYPLTCTPRGSNRSVFQDDAITATDRRAMGLMDAVQTIGLDSGTHADTNPPAANYLSRADAYREILDAHPTGEAYVFCYHNVTEAFERDTPARTKKIRDYLDALTGPDGNDGWCYNSSDEKVILFGEQFTINLSDYTLAVDGRVYPEWYADEIAQVEYLDVMAAAGIGVGKGGANIFLDNVKIRNNKSGIDWNNDGSNNNCQSYYDSEEPSHVAADPIATATYSTVRANIRKAIERWDAANPGHVTLINSNQWADNPADRRAPPTAPADLRNCILEYRLDGDEDNAFVQSGYSENNSSNEETEWPRSGVGANGLNRGQNGKWEKSYCNIYQSVRLAQAPKIVFATFSVECLQPGVKGAAGITVYPNVPAANAKWHMARWAMCTAWLAGAHSGISGIVVGTTKAGRAASTPLFDEQGVINGKSSHNGFPSGSTKLSPDWLGEAIDPPPVGPKPDGSYQRRYANGIIILNPNNDETAPPITIDVSELGGTYTRFLGYQDRITNDGSPLDKDFPMKSIDAGVYPDKEWYDAL